MTNTQTTDPKCLDADIEGAVNFRGLGGYRTQDGLVVRPGRVFRCGMMHHISPGGLVTLRDTLGLRTVVDLRNAEELSADGCSPFEEYGIDWRSVPIGGETVTTPEQRQERFEALAAGQVDWSKSYVQMSGRASGAFRTFFELAADPAHAPLVFHCTGGRDRTGVAAALLLSSLGVDDETIARDYSLTGGLLQPHIDRFARQMESLGMTRESWAALLETPAGAMRRFLAWLQEEYGGAEAYLRQAGVPTSAFEAATKHLLYRPAV